MVLAHEVRVAQANEVSDIRIRDLDIHAEFGKEFTNKRNDLIPCALVKFGEVHALAQEGDVLICSSARVAIHVGVVDVLGLCLFAHHVPYAVKQSVVFVLTEHMSKTLVSHNLMRDGLVYLAHVGNMRHVHHDCARARLIPSRNTIALANLSLGICILDIAEGFHNHYGYTEFVNPFSHTFTQRFATSILFLGDVLNLRFALLYDRLYNLLGLYDRLFYLSLLNDRSDLLFHDGSHLFLYNRFCCNLLDYGLFHRVLQREYFIPIVDTLLNFGNTLFTLLLTLLNLKNRRTCLCLLLHGLVEFLLRHGEHLGCSIFSLDDIAIVHLNECSPCVLSRGVLESFISDFIFRNALQSGLRCRCFHGLCYLLFYDFCSLLLHHRSSSALLVEGIGHLLYILLACDSRLYLLIHDERHRAITIVGNDIHDMLNTLVIQYSIGITLREGKNAINLVALHRGISIRDLLRLRRLQSLQLLLLSHIQNSRRSNHLDMAICGVFDYNRAARLARVD